MQNLPAASELPGTGEPCAPCAIDEQTERMLRNMRIAVIGARAMGSIYGGRLSLKNEVYLIATRETLAEEINSRGLKIEELGQVNIYHPTAVTDSSELGPMDLVILFVKATASETALSQNAGLIGPETRLMTLQNGAGHEDILGKFAPPERIIIGTTEDNGAVLGPAHVRRGGEGKTNVGKENEFRSPHICCTRTEMSTLEHVIKPITPDSPIAKAIGVPITMRVMNNVKDTASMSIYLLCHQYVLSDCVRP